MQESCLPLTYPKLDWASVKSLTTTPSREEFHQLCLLLNHIKEDLGLLRRLLTVNKFNTLIMGSETQYPGTFKAPHR